MYSSGRKSFSYITDSLLLLMGRYILFKTYFLSKIQVKKFVINRLET